MEIWHEYSPVHVKAALTNTPFNNLKSIEKDLTDALLLWSSTLALGLVEEGIWVWAAALESKLQCGLQGQGVQIYLYTLVSTIEPRLSDWPALEPRPRFILSPNPMPSETPEEQGFG